MEWSTTRAISIYDFLRKKIARPSIFFESKIGIDLWIDGYDAIASTSREIFAHYLRIYEEIHRGHSTTETKPTSNLFTALDEMLTACAKAGEAEFLHALAVGICVLYSCNVKPSIACSQGAIINDTIAILLSPNYRLIRYAAYDLGVVISFQELQDDRFFYPPAYRIKFGRPLAVKGRFWKCQFYNVSHEAGHIVYFADGYLLKYGDRYRTTQTFLAAEESLIGVDLLMYSEIARFDYDLHCLREFGGIDIATGNRFDQRVAVEVVQNRGLIVELQCLLRGVALFELDAYLKNDGSQISADLEGVELLDNWVGPAARRKHINGAIELAESLFSRDDKKSSITQQIRLWQEANMSRAMTETFNHGEIYMNMDLPEISTQKRKRNLARNRIRRDFLSSAVPPNEYLL